MKWGIDWGIFYWQLKNGFEVSTFILWFAIPFVFTYKSIDWKYFGVSRLKKNDIYVVILLSILAMIAVLSIKFFPSLRSFYPSIAFQNASAKLNWALYKMIWNMSWLTGWEFLHRYVLLTCFEKAFPNSEVADYSWSYSIEKTPRPRRPCPAVPGVTVLRAAVTNPQFSKGPDSRDPLKE